MSSKRYTEIEGYAAWALSFLLPIPGLYRVYLRKINFATLFFLIPGLGHILSIMDVFNIRNHVRDANLALEYKAALYSGGRVRSDFTRQNPPAAKKTRGKMSLEQIILQMARGNKGVVTPGEVALEAEITIDEARAYLEKLVSKGFAEMRIKKSGGISYCFPDFFDDAHDKDFEEI